MAAQALDAAAFALLADADSAPAFNNAFVAEPAIYAAALSHHDFADAAAQAALVRRADANAAV